MGTRVFRNIMLLLWGIPPLLKYFELDAYTFATVAIAFLFTGYNVLARNVRMDKSYYHFMVVSFFLVIINIISTIILYEEQYNFYRTLGAIGLMFIFLYSVFCFSNYLLKQPKENIDKLFKYLFYFFVVIVILSPFTTMVFGYYPKPVFPYSEPSHMALFFAPVLCYNVLNTDAKKRYIYILIGLVIALFVKNMTLLVSILVMSVFIYNVYVLPILGIGGVMVFYFADIEYFIDRLDFGNSDTTNLSTLVYMKGFDLMKQALIQSNGLGIGFQQLGYVEVESEIRDYIIKLTDGVDLNSNDGGFLAAKIVAEFGVIGIILLLYYLILLVRSWLIFRKIEISQLKSYELLFFASIITIFSELFFRGLGYFTSNIFILIACIYLNHKLKILKTLNRKFSR